VCVNNISWGQEKNHVRGLEGTVPSIHTGPGIVPGVHTGLGAYSHLPLWKRPHVRGIRESTRKVLPLRPGVRSDTSITIHKRKKWMNWTLSKWKFALQKVVLGDICTSYRLGRNICKAYTW
jgi:hypothetical protein